MEKEYEYRKLKPIELIDEEEVDMTRCNKVRVICSSDGRNIGIDPVYRFDVNLPDVLQNCYGFSVVELSTNKFLLQNMNFALGYQFMITQGVNNYVLTIPDGWWSIASLSTYLTRQFVPAIPGFAIVSYDNNRVAFTATSSITLPFSNPGFTTKDIFGFGAWNTDLSGTTIVSPAPPNLRFPDMISLNSIVLTNNKYKTYSNLEYSSLNKARNQLCLSDLVVPSATATFFARELLPAGETYPQFRFPSTRDIKTFDLYLSNREGVPPELLVNYWGPSAQWYAVLIFFCK